MLPVRLHYRSSIPPQCYSVAAASMGRARSDADTLQVNKERWRHPDGEKGGGGLTKEQSKKGEEREEQDTETNRGSQFPSMGK